MTITVKPNITFPAKDITEAYEIADTHLNFMCIDNVKPIVKNGIANAIVTMSLPDSLNKDQARNVVLEILDDSIPGIEINLPDELCIPIAG